MVAGMMSFTPSRALRIFPWPSGKIFALTFVDDTDYATRDNIEPVYGLLSEIGLRGTKTVWTTAEKRNSAFRRDLERLHDPGVFNGSSLEDPDYLEFVQGLSARGFEIALHNIAAGNSTRAEIIEGLERFRKWFGRYPTMNIFHAQNIENIYAGQDKLDNPLFRMLERLKDRSDYQGHVPGSEYFWGDLAKQHFTYVRLPFHTIQHINTLRCNPGMPFFDPRRPMVNYWFASSDGSNCRRFLRLLQPEKLNQLEREHGACLIYTHFGVGFTKRRDSQYRLNPDFEALVRGLAGNVNGWYPTTSQLLDRLRFSREISIRQDGFEVLVTGGRQPVDEVVLAANPGTILTDSGGNRIEADRHGLLPIGDVSAGERRRFTSNRRARFDKPGNSGHSITRRERLRLEFLNYLGLISA